MKDNVLISLIAVTEMDPPIEHDITLLVSGFLVSGSVIVLVQRKLDKSISSLRDNPAFGRKVFSGITRL